MNKDTTNTQETIADVAGLMGSEASTEAREKSNAYAQEMPKNRAKVRKLLLLAFHTTTGDAEATAAFLAAKKQLVADNIGISDVVRADWGGGPLVAAIAKVGHVVMPTGIYMGRSLAWIIENNANYIVDIHNKKAWREGPTRDAIKVMHDGFMAELVCRFTGDWDDDPDIARWNQHGEDANWGTNKEKVPHT